MITTKIRRDAQADVAERFAKDVAGHAMTVLHDDGLYRHLRFAEPNHSFYWFDLVTWPGSLAIRGDCGGHMFTRTRDMFEFFRRNGNDHGINPGYWAEKLPDGARSVRKFSEDELRARVEESVTEYGARLPDLVHRYDHAKIAYDQSTHSERWPLGSTREPVKPKTLDEVRELIQDYDDDGRLSHEEGARELLGELQRAGVASDSWEWDLSDWDWQFLWCCHAIAWGVRQYDAAKAAPAAAEEVPTP